MRTRLALLFTLIFLSSCFFDTSGYVENPYVETACSDDLDNDEDTFVDCDDQDCCAAEHCKTAPICAQIPENEAPTAP